MIMTKDESPAIREYRIAFEEYFKGKPKPKNEIEMKKEMHEFMHWYNNVRKQSDTGKTPTQMYGELHGRKPKKLQRVKLRDSKDC